jgi:hypothetical protein
VSKKLPGIRFVPVELEVGGEATAEGAKALQQFVASGLARYAELSSVRDVDFDLVAFPESERFDHDGRKANRKAVPPFCDLHAGSPSIGIYMFMKVYLVMVKVKEAATGAHTNMSSARVRSL